MVVTRATELQTIFKRLNKGSSYGAATTHHEKLWPRLDGGGGGGCPVLTFAITPALFVDDGPKALAALKAKIAAAKQTRIAARRKGLPAPRSDFDIDEEDDEES